MRAPSNKRKEQDADRDKTWKYRDLFPNYFQAVGCVKRTIGRFLVPQHPSQVHFMHPTASFSPAGAEPFYVAAGAEEEVVFDAIRFQPLGFGGQFFGIGSLGHEHYTRAFDLGH